VLMTEIAFDVRIAFGEFDLQIDHRMPLEGVVGLFGPSGGGKSTLLRILSGLERNAHGQIRFGSEVWQDDTRGIFVPPHKRGVGYVFQDVRLFPHLTVSGNLRYADKRISCAALPSGFQYRLPDCGRGSAMNTEAPQVELSLTDAVHQFDPGYCDRCVAELLEPQYRRNTLPDATMVLLNQGIEVFRRPQFGAPRQRTIGFQLTHRTVRRSVGVQRDRLW